MNLNDLGWSSDFAQAFTSLGTPDLQPGRITAVHRGRWLVALDTHSTPALLTGRLRAAGELPVVGDWVALRPRPDEPLADLHHVLPRRSVLARTGGRERAEQETLAANLDILFIVMGLDANYNLRRLERFLALGRGAGLECAVVLNKSDLRADWPAAVREVQLLAPGVSVLAAAAASGLGLERIRDAIGPGRTAAFVGSSGVGKSTLVNELLGEARQATLEVSSHGARGQHTTVTRELFLLPGGGVVIDTPGLRELRLPAGDAALPDVFAEVVELAARCRFSDCRHAGEPGCAVQSALAEGRLDPARVRALAKLEREQAWLAERGDPRAAHARKERWKKIHREARSLAKARHRQ
ncbi:MAG: ribosome small subunit-dependent GTPase A [Verrucomicrobia bacterium]|nr:ribosome small subunit-dependent GTPase A [Verrucomicrobiota bacterium]